MQTILWAHNLGKYCLRQKLIFHQVSLISCFPSFVTQTCPTWAGKRPQDQQLQLDPSLALDMWVLNLVERSLMQHKVYMHHACSIHTHRSHPCTYAWLSHSCSHSRANTEKGQTSTLDYSEGPALQEALSTVTWFPPTISLPPSSEPDRVHPAPTWGLCFHQEAPSTKPPENSFPPSLAG